MNASQKRRALKALQHTLSKAREQFERNMRLLKKGLEQAKTKEHRKEYQRLILEVAEQFKEHVGMIKAEYEKIK